MSEKAAKILLHCFLIGWLIGFLGTNDKSTLGGRMITQGMLIWIIACVPFIGWVASMIFAVLCIVNVAKGDLDYHCPVIGEVNWFKQY